MERGDRVFRSSSRLGLTFGSLVALVALPGCPMTDDYFVVDSGGSSGAATGGVGGSSGPGGRDGKMPKGDAGGGGLSGATGGISGSGGVSGSGGGSSDGWTTTSPPPGAFSPR